ncbi:MAG: YggS family pyridoxal phosphate-dependent enzyme [Spirochaetota bacterium]
MVAERLQNVRERIARAAELSGRSADEVRLLAVTKTHPRELVDEAIAAGHSLFGENRVQEAGRKYAGLESDVELHLIGHLQSNKARHVPGLFSWVESIDSLAIAQAVSRRCASADRICNVLLQYNSSGEGTKSGYEDGERLLAEAAEIAGLPGLRLRGVMTIGPFVDDEPRIARAFSETRTLFERLRSSLPEDEIDTLSMGMTGDFEIAVAEGSTEVRVGSAIFGSRS